MEIKRAYIGGLASYFPEKIYSNSDIENDYPKWSGESVLNKIGIEKRHILGEGEYVTDMAYKAATKLLEESEINNIKRSEIDFVILCTQSPDFTIPTTACILQHELKLNKNIGAFDFNLGCSGFVYGLGIAKGLILSNQARNILLITSEAYSKRIHKDDFKNRSIFGDAAVATLITDHKISNYCEILDFYYNTDGSGYGKLIHFNSGNKVSNKESRFMINYEEPDFGSDYLYMDGKAIFEFTLTQVPNLIKNTLEKNKLNKSEIELFIMHQANKFMLDAIRKRANIEDVKFYISMKDYGNTVSSTIPIALLDAMRDNRVIEGSKVLIAGFGVGLSMGGCVLNF